MAIILVVGIGIFSYPFVEDSLNDFLAANDHPLSKASIE